MSSVIQYFKAKNANVGLTVKSVKKKIGHEQELLFSCKIYHEGKHIADFIDEDWGAGITINVIHKNQKQYDSAIAKLNDIPAYHEEVLNSDINVQLDYWASEACTIFDIESTIKREKGRAYFNETDKSVRLFTKKRGTQDSLYQEHMKKMKNIIPFFDISIEEILPYYLDLYKIKTI